MTSTLWIDTLVLGIALGFYLKTKGVNYLKLEKKNLNLAKELEDLQAKILQLENSHKWLLKSVCQIQNELIKSGIRASEPHRPN